MAGYLGARAVAGLLGPDQGAGVDAVVLFMGYAAVQGATAAAIVRLFPGG